ncbi:MAG: glycosyltransferase family 2 protein [Phycisphaerales bacterium]|nr:glycosyltransferase family 2 protein [Phycisphaerales bacterium]
MTAARPTTVPVTVVVVNFNGGRFLERCMACLARQATLPERIELVDCASTDGSADALEAAVRSDESSDGLLSAIAGRLSVDRAGRNLGFAAANNRAIERCATPLVALLNPDAFAEPDWLRRLCDAAGRHPDCASFGSRQMLEGHPGMVDGIGDAYHVGGMPWRSRHRRRLRPDDLRAREIFSPCAAAALYRTDAVRSVGAFDADFFCYCEDVDLGFRLRLAGHSCRYVPEAVVHHVGAASSGHRHSDTVVYHGHRNLVWTFAKDMPLALLPLAIPAHLATTAASLVVLGLRGQAGAFVRAKVDALSGLPAVLRKRAAVQQARRAGAGAILGSMRTGLWRG